MFTDLKNIFVPSTGGNPNIAEVEVGDTVFEDTRGADTKEGFQDYEDFIGIIETSKQV